MTTATAASPVMIGRERELATLRQAFDDGRAGRPRAVVVRGEAGIGKTRLLDEFRAAAAASTGPADPPLVLATGQCVDLGPIGTPFAPIRRLLRDVLSAVGREAFVEAALTPSLVTALATLVPSLGEAAPPAAAVSPDLVTEAIETLVENLSDGHHLVLVLEDLHWADSATLALLRTLAATLRGEHVTMVMTYRSDDVDRFHPLRPVIAELERNRGVVGVDLARLTPAQVAEQASLIAGRGAPAADASLLAERSGGIPFLVEELLGVGGRELPDTLRDVVAARYERLSEPTRELVRVVAAGGVHVDHDLLLAVSDIAPADVDTALREAIGANVLVGEGDGYAFRHALTQEAVHDDLLASERVRLHGRYAVVLEARAAAGRPGSATETAHHWRLAREPERALVATAQAFREASAAGAVASVPELVDAIVDLWPQVPAAEKVAGEPQWRFLRQASVALGDLGEAERGGRLADEALTVCPPNERRERADLLRLKNVHRINAGLPADPALWDEAESLLAGSDDPADQALLARIWTIAATYVDAPFDERLAVTERALALARRAGTDEDVSYCLAQRGMLLSTAGDLPAALEDYRVAAEATTDPLDLRKIALAQIDALDYLGRYDEAVAGGERALEALRAAGHERGMASYIAANLVEAYVLSGRPDRAVDLFPRTMALLVDAPWRSYAARVLAAHHVWDDDPDGWERLVALGAHQAPNLDWEERAGWSRVRLERLLALATDASSDDERARLVSAALDEAAVILDPSADALPAFAHPLVPAVARAVAAGRRAGVAVPPELGERLTAVLAGLPDVPIARVWSALAAAEQATSGEVAAWTAAVEVLDEVSAPAWFLPYALLRQGEALLAAGDRDAAATALARAAADAPGVGVGLVARWARRAAARAGVPLAAADDRPGRARVAPAATGLDALTARELQVLELVAAGLTNPQIGQRLFISPKTASVHVSAILAKIGAATRAEAAAIYTQRGGARAASAGAGR